MPLYHWYNGIEGTRRLCTARGLPSHPDRPVPCLRRRRGELYPWYKFLDGRADRSDGEMFKGCAASIAVERCVRVRPHVSPGSPRVQTSRGTMSAADRIPEASQGLPKRGTRRAAPSG